MAKAKKFNAETVQAIVADKGFPEVGSIEKDDLKKFYKHLSVDQLQEWLELEGLEYTPNDSAPINRMRMCMAILYNHFPKQAVAKKKAKYADYTTEQLMDMAIDKDVVFETTDDERILRMRAIMALRAAGHIQ